MKKAVLLHFRLTPTALIQGPGYSNWWDKRPGRTGWGAEPVARCRVQLPGAVVRRSAHIARGVVLMPSFVNVGAYVDENTMVDTWVTVGSCAQIGKNVHISGRALRVLEPAQVVVIIEDTIGARSEVVEGVVVGEGSVILDGRCSSAPRRRSSIPPHGRSAHRQGAALLGGGIGQPARKPLPNGEPGPSLYCAVIVKKVDAQTRSKTSINGVVCATNGFGSNSERSCSGHQFFTAT